MVWISEEGWVGKFTMVGMTRLFGRAWVSLGLERGRLGF